MFSEVQRETSGMKLVNPFVLNAPFLYNMKTLEYRKDFWGFQGLEKGALGANGLICLFSLFLTPLSQNISFLVIHVSFFWLHV